MIRAAVPAIVAVLVLTSTARAEIVDPVFVRGNRLTPGTGTGVSFDTLTAYTSAVDMAANTNGSGVGSMQGNDQWGWDRWKFYDGTNYYRIEKNLSGPWLLHSYGPRIVDLIRDDVQTTQAFTAALRGNVTDSDYSAINFFGGSDGAIYEVWGSDEDMILFGVTDKVTKFESVADLLAGTGTDYDSVQYHWGDNYIEVNGTFYRTNTVADPGGLIAESDVFGIVSYNSFADLLSNTAATVHGGGTGLAWDLFMAVPRAALPVGSGGAPVPEIDPAGMGSVLALVGGVLGLLERRRTRA